MSVLSREKVLKEVKKIFMEVFSFETGDINEDLTVGDSEKWDSMGHLTLFLHIENKLKVRFTAEEIIEARSVRRITDKLMEKL